MPVVHSSVRISCFNIAQSSCVRKFVVWAYLPDFSQPLGGGALEDDTVQEQLRRYCIDQEDILKGTTTLEQEPLSLHIVGELAVDVVDNEFRRTLFAAIQDLVHCTPLMPSFIK